MPRAAFSCASGVTNTVLFNGGRLYVDHAHPEYASPEVINPREAVLWDRAGDFLAQEAMQILAQEGKNYAIYKNNVDGKGAAYGTHENYLLSRNVDFTDVIRYLTPFFVTRPIICGAGRVGLGQKSQYPGFQISQRADYVENTVGLETTFNRPIINTRDEPHADGEKYRRLHVIGGDANQFDYSNLLKVGTTSLVLWLLEQDDLPLELDALLMFDAVAASWEVSHDISLRKGIEMHDGISRTAIEIQQVYLDAVLAAVERVGNDDFDTVEILQLWQEVLDALRGDMTRAARKVEWVAKYLALDGLRKQKQLPWDAPQIRAFDLQWHDLRASKSIAQKLIKLGQVDQIFTPEQVQWAVINPPEQTRAYFRGNLLRYYGKQIPGAAWASVIFDLPNSQHLLRLSLPEPFTGTKEQVGMLFSAGLAPDALLAAYLRQIKSS
ncbi:depupylase/deamidase Dop [Arcanobacterium hippocoleae]|uniref:depupylase/deamidase Dop n=1 Tax=Arcanobacterium hippocoleae TaxID=149017 RepID=UPI0033417281